MMDNDKKFIISAILYGVSILAIVIVVGNAFNRYLCNQRGKKMGIESSYEIIGGCFYHVNGKFIPDENYRVMGE